MSEITWDGGTLLLQGIFAEPGGELKTQYFVVPTESTKLEHRDTQTDASLEYWRKKASRTSPTGLGRIQIGSDTKMPQFGLGGPSGASTTPWRWAGRRPPSSRSSVRSSCSSAWV